MQQKGISDEAVGVPTTFVVYPRRLQAEAPDENETENMKGSSMQQAMMMERRKKAAAGDKQSEQQYAKDENMATHFHSITVTNSIPPA